MIPIVVRRAMPFLSGVVLGCVHHAVGREHTDYGPAVRVGLSSAQLSGLRPYLAIRGDQGGPAGADGMVYAAVDASYPLDRSWVFLQPEIRLGIFGESGYKQVAVGIVVRR